MTDFGIAIEIAASPARVWAVMRDVERWPEWTASVTRVERLTPGPFAPGSRVRVLQPKLPPTIWTVTEVDDAARYFTWIAGAPGMRVVARHSVEATATGSRGALSLRYSGLFGPLLARLTRDLNHRYLALEANGLKSRSEGAPA
jgi:uncharacterized protein YndB with AHSA1/START domain